MATDAHASRSHRHSGTQATGAEPSRSTSRRSRATCSPLHSAGTALLLSLLFAVTTAAFVHTPVHALPLTLVPPFGPGETWYVCQGYNSNLRGTYHRQQPYLDLSTSAASAGPDGCNPETASSAAGRPVLAMAAGTSRVDGDGICMSYDRGGGAWIGHLTDRVEGKVKAGDRIGNVSAPNVPNGGYAHIHLSLRSGPGCSGVSLPFSNNGGVAVQGWPDLPYSGTVNQYSGQELQHAQVLAAQPSNPVVSSTGGTNAVLVWGDASNDETGFVVQYRIGAGSWIAGPSVGANVTSMNVTGLVPGTAYTFQVGARNAAGTKWSAFFYGTTVAPPAQPTAYHAGRQVTIDTHATGGVSGHKGPGDSFATGPTRPANSALWIVCYVRGESITGPYNTTNIWNLSDDGYYYTDAWLYTGSNGAVVPHC